ncbi:hypothetical protein KO02_21485 [Sphingobacterium sp. ML3W]|uniref:hypothetical protein n=1 Tax=Sphingobacterium sp. ML3W TaxID=1538644 RepID=UPI0004F8B53A|nr:hypothetical protein [Sphingobacterium sp. ML3W]AIM38980.1 hypothetical protein KO02_21485 [Sphingobacterium sp. ML3W]
MNFSGIKKANWIVATVLLATSGMLATSCSKENNASTENTDEYDGTNLVLTVKGINENQTLNEEVKQSSVNTKSTKMSVKSYADVDVVSSIDNNVPFNGTSEVISQKNNGSGQVANANTNLRAATLNAGVTYRLYLLSADGTQVVSSQQFTTGSTGTTIGVTPGATYKWVALSYNNAEAIPTIATGSTSILLPENKDVLYTSGNVTIPSAPGADVSLPITFQHAFSRLAIELNSMGVFGNMNSGTVSVSGLALKTATIDVATGALTPSASTYTPAINWNSFTNIDAAYNDAKIAYVYTAGTSTLSNVEVSVSDLAVTHSDGVDRTFGSASPIKISYSITPTLGNSHRLLANIVESALTATGLSQTGTTVKWSRSNLYYAAGTRNPYRFFAENKQRSDANSYFAYGALTPAKFTATPGDPCAAVYPAGLWKQPKSSDYFSVTNGEGLLSGLLTSVGTLIGARDETPNSSIGVATATGNYAQYTSTAGGNNAAFNDASNNIRFYYNGQLAQVSVLPNDFLNLDLTAVANLLGASYGSQATFWASDAPGNLLGLVELGTYGYLATTEQQALLGIPTGTKFVRAKRTGELLSKVSLLGLDVLSSTLKNVRCVRAI